MNLIRAIIIFFLFTTGVNANKMEQYMENCVDDYYDKYPKTDKLLDTIVMGCAIYNDNFKAKFYYYKGKVYSKPRR